MALKATNVTCRYRSFKLICLGNINGTSAKYLRHLDQIFFIKLRLWM